MSTKYIKLDQPQTARLSRLLHMEYTFKELADEVGCGVPQIRRAVEAGCPNRTTDKHTWVVGDEFTAWYLAAAKARKRPLHRDEAFCLGCRIAVPLDESVVAPVRPGVERVSGLCPRCGNPVHRFRSVP